MLLSKLIVLIDLKWAILVCTSLLCPLLQVSTKALITNVSLICITIIVYFRYEFVMT